MAAVKISDLNLVGSTLLMDSESYLNELTDLEMSITKGGSSLFCLSISFSIGFTIASSRRYFGQRGGGSW